MEDGRLPRLSVDLIRFLDENEPKPTWPVTKAEWAEFDQYHVRELVYLAGKRAMIDSLVSWLEEEEADAEERNTRFERPPTVEPSV